MLLAALLTLNGWLLLLNLAKHDRLPQPFDRVPGVAEAMAEGAERTAAGDGAETADGGGDAADGGGSATDDGDAAAFTTDASVVAAQDGPVTIEVDEWPGGRGPAPDGPPIPRRVRVLADGGLLVTGSAPSWSVVTDLVDAVGRRLGVDPSTIDIEVGWHPEASDRLVDGEAIVDAPLLYQPGQIELPDGAGPALAPAVALLAAHPELYAVVVGLVDEAGVDADDEVSAVALGRTTVVAEVFTDGGIASDRIVTSVAPVGDDAAMEQTGERVLVRIENLLVFGSGS